MHGDGPRAGPTCCGFPRFDPWDTSTVTRTGQPDDRGRPGPADPGRAAADGTRRPLRSVVAAVLTYQRHDHLSELLGELCRQAAAAPLSARVLVVDNNPDASARPLVQGLDLPGLGYVHEPEPGIVAGRNAALAWADGADAIAFLDDDETPSEHWLEHLVRTAAAYGAAGVTGPVVRDYPRPPSAYVHGMRRWDRVRRATGSDVPAASTANLLLDLRFLHDAGLSFDPAFGLSGGSDTLLTKQLIRAGGRLIWCDEAVVHDHVAPERLTATWVAGRGRRVGNTHSRVSLTLDPGLGTRAALVVRGLGLQAWGAATTVAGSLRRDPEVRGSGRWRRSRGRGIVDGAIGRTHFDYRRPAP